MVAKYLQVTFHWGICYKRSKPLTLSEDDFKQGFFPTTSYDIPNDPTLKELFNVDINTNELVGFVNTAYDNKLRKCQSTTGVVFTFMGGAVVYKTKTQSITASSSTKAEFIAAHAAAKIACYLQILLKQLGYKQIGPTPIHIDNLPVLKMINDNTLPTECTRHIDVQYFQLKD